MPSSSGGSGCASMGNMAGPPMADATMSGFMSLQTAPPSAADMAAQLMSMLDTDGDGSISASEANASGSSDAASAFSTLDTNGDGKISADELTSAVQSAKDEMASAQDASGGQGPSGVHHGRHHHHASATDLATGIMDAADSDQSGGLSLDEVSSALGVSSTDAQAGFSALDTDGDGTLSAAELTSAIDKYMQSRFSDYTTQAQSSLTASVTA